MNHNSAQRDETGETAGQKGLHFHLTGSQAKTKRAIEINVDRMAREATAPGAKVTERVGFLTLTVGNWEGDEFVQVHDHDEANRRINNLARRFLPSLFVRWVIVTERHKTGAIHFHLAVETRVDIRGRYDWAAVRDGDYRTASEQLRAIWAILRAELPAFGFGRAQLEPAKGNECLARYVAKYIEKNLFARGDEDKGRKLVRYGGWKGTHCRANDTCWVTPRAIAWRTKVASLAELAMVTRRERVAEAFGPKWSFTLTRIMQAIDDRPEPGGFEWSYPERETARQIVCRVARRRFLKRAENDCRPLPVEWRPQFNRGPVVNNQIELPIAA